MECRRCSDCANSSHHWLNNGDFGNDEAEAEEPTGNSHVCKHCDAVGNECQECDGTGEVMDDEGCVGFECKACNGEGVIVSKRRTYAEFEASLDRRTL